MNWMSNAKTRVARMGRKKPQPFSSTSNSSRPAAPLTEESTSATTTMVARQAKPEQIKDKAKHLLFPAMDEDGAAQSLSADIFMLSSSSSHSSSGPPLSSQQEGERHNIGTTSASNTLTFFNDGRVVLESGGLLKTLKPSSMPSLLRGDSSPPLHITECNQQAPSSPSERPRTSLDASHYKEIGKTLYFSKSEASDEAFLTERDWISALLSVTRKLPQELVVSLAADLGLAPSVLLGGNVDLFPAISPQLVVPPLYRSVLKLDSQSRYFHELNQTVRHLQVFAENKRALFPDHSSKVEVGHVEVAGPGLGLYGPMGPPCFHGSLFAQEGGVEESGWMGDIFGGALLPSDSFTKPAKRKHDNHSSHNEALMALPFCPVASCPSSASIHSKPLLPLFSRHGGEQQQQQQHPFASCSSSSSCSAEMFIRDEEETNPFPHDLFRQPALEQRSEQQGWSADFEMEKS